MKLTEQKLRQLIKEELSERVDRGTLTYQYIDDAYDLLENAKYESEDRNVNRQINKILKMLKELLYQV